MGSCLVLVLDIVGSLNPRRARTYDMVDVLERPLWRCSKTVVFGYVVG